MLHRWVDALLTPDGHSFQCLLVGVRWSQRKSLAAVEQHRPHKPSSLLMSGLTPSTLRVRLARPTHILTDRSDARGRDYMGEYKLKSAVWQEHEAARHAAAAVVGTSLVPLCCDCVAVHTALPVRCWFRRPEFSLGLHHEGVRLPTWLFSHPMPPLTHECHMSQSPTQSHSWCCWPHLKWCC